MKSLAFFSCMLAGCLFLRTAFLQWASSRREAFWLAALAVGFLFLGMEEISWGQWFIGWETPATFEGNLQHETNLHNMSFIHFYAHEIGLAVFSIYFVIIPLIYHGIPMTSPLFDKIGLPIADLSIAALFATVFILFIRPFSLLYGASAGGALNYGEMQEFIYEFCALLLAYQCWRKAKAHGAYSAANS
ncbi:hypothetical protein ACFO1V_02940 [Daeguia caeni]|uniref:Lycopene cyclase domain-containing protein n=1 Tax=Daeguia caeni TaxID=439612 RepID=A0ABV9H181_9HYPH